MAVIKQGGGNPYAGKVMTTQGYKEHRAPVCTNCRQRKDGQLYTVNANGQIVCADCSGNRPCLRRLRSSPTTAHRGARSHRVRRDSASPTS